MFDLVSNTPRTIRIHKSNAPSLHSVKTQEQKATEEAAIEEVGTSPRGWALLAAARAAVFTASLRSSDSEPRGPPLCALVPPFGVNPNTIQPTRLVTLRFLELEFINLIFEVSCFRLVCFCQRTQGVIKGGNAQFPKICEEKEKTVVYV